MQIAIVGLGRMGMNMARRLLRGGHRVIGYNRSPEKTDRLVHEGGIGAYALEEMVRELQAPRTVWLMLPAGQVVDEYLDRLRGLLSPGDLVVDGGNTYYKDDIRRERLLSGSGLHFMDAGVSGGVHGLDIGYCLMIGGPEESFRYLEPVFKTLAPEAGYLHCGPAGSGHFVKMVHNGIEYAMMEAYGEGFALLEASPYSRSLDYARVARLWNRGSVIRSWLLELAEEAFSKDPGLSRVRGYVEDSGEGRWTVKEAVESGVSAPAIAVSLMRRFQSQSPEDFSFKVQAALRHEFGGHPVKSSGDNA